ncbi:MAG TPA: nuclear transport factor 2 family protein, partial [Candidatus Elarobacter sp.]|nr:nuclear transport factor 2 family protein [Candidatus Elarobacter sp.]
MKTLLLLSSAAVAIASTSHVHMVPAGNIVNHKYGDSVLVRTDVDAADRALSAASARGMLGALSDSFTDDVVLLYPGQPIAQGRAVAIAVLEDVPSARRLRMTWRAVRGEISADGSRAYTSGYGRSTLAGSTDSAHVRYIAYWRRINDRWRVGAMVITPAAVGGFTSAPAGCGARAAATARTATQGRTDAREQRRALLATDADFSARSARDGAAAAFGAFIADDGANLGGRAEMVCGRGAVERMMQGIGPGELVW